MIALLIAGFLALPLVVFRRATLRAYLAFEVISYGLAAAAWWLIRPQDTTLFVVSCAVLKLAAFSVALAAGEDVEWSATRAALIAAIVYVLVIPTQMRTPIDGDEPYYLLITESLVKDRDVDLANQYSDLAHSATGRKDLKPQSGDAVGRHGEQYSRYEPFLPLLLVPGYLAAGLPGALATIALFGVFLARSTVRLLEDEGIDPRVVRALFPLFAFAPPVVFYAARLWPEVPGALCFVEALRGVRQHRMRRWVPALFGLAMLKLRFVLIALVLVLAACWRRRAAVLAIAIIAVPLLVVWMITGNALNVHSYRELMPFPGRNYVLGAFGLALDGAAGILFQAPLYLLGLFAVLRWNSLPAAFRLGIVAALPYVVSLVPRSEWHGGWSPPLRYIVVFMPVLFLGAAWVVERMKASAIVAIAAVWSVGLTIHGLAYPWRLFHVANGENAAGEWLSRLHGSDYSRLFPSFIRLNEAAVAGGVVLCVALVLFAVLKRLPSAPVAIAVLTAVLATAFLAAQSPAERIEFEDAHVTHDGGELYPETYTVARFFYRGGWLLREGDSLSFLARAGVSRLEYACATPVTIEVGGRPVVLPPTGRRYGEARVIVPRDGRTTLRCVSGVVNVDRMEHY